MRCSKNLVGITVSSLSKLTKCWEPYGHDVNGVSENRMLPLSRLGLRQIKREASSFSTIRTPLTLYQAPLPSTTPNQRDRFDWSPSTNLILEQLDLVGGTKRPRA